MSDEEAAAHRAPGTIVQNSAVFCDRSARCAAASRPFSPRGLLWLFLRKKERKKMRAEACGAHAFVADLRGPRLRPRGAGRRSLLQTEFSLYFWLDPKVPKGQARRKASGNVWCLTKTGACRGFTAHSCRFDCGGSAKSASGLCPRLWPSLQANRPRFFTFDTARFFLRAFRSAIVQAFGLPKSRIPMRG